MLESLKSDLFQLETATSVKQVNLALALVCRG